MTRSGPVGPVNGRAMAPQVSVIIPAFNHERFVADALDSARDEGYPNLEILLIDDGSTDRTLARAHQWAEVNPKCRVAVSSQPNAGLTTTLNRLLDRASGEYVVYLASDDRLLRGGIAARLDYLLAHPSLSAVYGDCRVIDGDGNEVRERGMADGDQGARRRSLSDPAREVVTNWAVAGSVIFYRRSDIIAMGGYTEGQILEDWDLYLRLASRGAIAYLDVVVAEYRTHGSNTATSEAKALAIADEMMRTAWRSRRLFRGHLRLELIHESATWAAKAASIRRKPLTSIAWRLASGVMKLIAAAVPRRASDQYAVRSADRWAG